MPHKCPGLTCMPHLTLVDVQSFKPGLLKVTWGSLQGKKNHDCPSIEQLTARDPVPQQHLNLCTMNLPDQKLLYPSLQEIFPWLER